DPNHSIAFASLQSSTGRAILDKFHLKNDLTTMVVLEDEHCYVKSTGVLHVLRRLTFPWFLFYYLFILIPWFIRDLVYSFVARNRYSWFGKISEAECRFPTPDFKSRFLDWNEDIKQRSVATE